jgi:hypothetical protein
MRLCLIVTLAFVPLLPTGAQVSSSCSQVREAARGVAAGRALAGVYDVEWRPDSGAVRLERLWLWQTLPTDSARKPPYVRAAPDDTLRYFLWGTLRPRSVAPSGADSLRRITDPIDPPVLLVAWPRSNELYLLVGTVTTRHPGMMAFDGAGVGIAVRQADTSGVAGRYAPWGITRTESGFFCARRIA